MKDVKTRNKPEDIFCAVECYKCEYNYRFNACNPDEKLTKGACSAMNRFDIISESEVLAYAMKGLSAYIAKAPIGEVDILNQQYLEINEQRKKIKAYEDTPPFDCD